MRVKIGDQWFEPAADQAIMIELTEGDRRNIRNMAPGATKYAVFHDDDERDHGEMNAWME